MRTLLVDGVLRPGRLRIEGEEVHHGRNVLRLVAGDAIRLADGHGHEAIAKVAEVGRHHIDVEGDAPQVLPDLAADCLTVAVAPPKGDRFADLIRGLTELGVGTILPLACERGERMPNLERAERIALEALKQCRRPRRPRIGPVTDFSTLTTLPGHRIVLDQAGSPAQPGDASPTVLIIGPEGGFTYDERERLLADGARSMRLAGTILRIETAAVAAAAVWIAAWESVAS